MDNNQTANENMCMGKLLMTVIGWCYGLCVATCISQQILKINFLQKITCMGLSIMTADVMCYVVLCPKWNHLLTGKAKTHKQTCMGLTISFGKHFNQLPTEKEKQTQKPWALD